MENTIQGATGRGSVERISAVVLLLQGDAQIVSVAGFGQGLNS